MEDWSDIMEPEEKPYERIITGGLIACIIAVVFGVAACFGLTLMIYKQEHFTAGPAHGQGDSAYVGAVLMDNGNVCFAPRNADYVGIYNPTSNTFVQGPAHGQGDGAYVGAVLMDNGNVCFAPYIADYVGIYERRGDSRPITLFDSQPDYVLDQSGNGNTGTVVGATMTTDGMSFDGVNDYIDCNAIMVSNNDHTVTAWIKATSTAGISAKPIISQYAVGVSGRTRWIYGLNGYWRFINSGTSGANIISQTNIFIFIAITVESGTIIAYANGNPEFTVGGFDDVQATDMLFGKDNSDNYGDCVLSQTRIYGRAITPTEVTNLYLSGRNAPADTISTNNLLLFYDFDYRSKTLRVE